MSHNLFKFILLTLAIAFLATGCQELTLNVEIPPSSPTGRPAPTALPPTRPAPTWTPAAPTPVSTALPGRLQPGSPVQIAAIRMLDAQQGWGIGNRGTGRQDAILRTADGGLTWRDVTPPLPENPAGSTRQAAAAFIDAQHAWVTYFNPTPSPIAAPPDVWFTTDGGASWGSSPLDVNGAQLEYLIPGIIGFSDVQNGWLLAHVGAGMSHDYVAIFTTTDGGRSWKRVVDPQVNNLPMGCRKTGLVFLSPRIGYLSGDCMGVTSGIYLLRTADGGVTWQDVKLPPPADRPDLFTDRNTICGIDTLSSPAAQELYIPVRCSSVGSSSDVRRWLYASHDGGSTFQALSMPAQYGSFQFLNPSTAWLIGGFTPDATRFTLFKTVDSGAAWKTVANLGWQGEPDFVDGQSGWVVALSSSAAALVHTGDGGVTWREIKPHVAGS